MIKAVLFDLDGTLADSLSDLADSTNFALTRMGYPIHERDKYKYFVGDGILKLIERAMPENERNSEEIKKCFDIFMERYSNHYFDNTVPYNGILTLINTLKKQKLSLAVVSNKAQAMAEKVVEKLFGKSFNLVAGKRDGYLAKPDPTLTLEVIKELAITPNECVLIGDSGMDMAAAKNAGVISIGVLWGFREKDELINSGADYIVSSPDEIVKIIGEL